eukprot:EG_transcript_22659
MDTHSDNWHCHKQSDIRECTQQLTGGCAVRFRGYDGESTQSDKPGWYGLQKASGCRSCTMGRGVKMREIQPVQAGRGGSLFLECGFLQMWLLRKRSVTVSNKLRHTRTQGTREKCVEGRSEEQSMRNTGVRCLKFIAGMWLRKQPRHTTLAPHLMTA